LPGDFYAAKGLLAGVLAVAGVECQLVAQQWPFLHPARSATVMSEQARIGFIGELHPLVASAWDLERVAVWAVDVGKLAALAPPLRTFAPFGEYPSAREDLAVVLDEGVAAGDVIAAIREAGGEQLAGVELFDVYRGPQVGEGKLSLALHLEFRSLERTLTSEEIAPLREKIASVLADRFGGALRA
jgi:phenylalanyl-tRNA synthetase beta chain